MRWASPGRKAGQAIIEADQGEKAGAAMLRVGVDLMDIARVGRTVERYGDRFYRRFFTDKERKQCEGQPNRLAARIAVKEAAAKALGTGIGDVSWIEIEVDGDDRG